MCHNPAWNWMKNEIFHARPVHTPGFLFVSFVFLNCSGTFVTFVLGRFFFSDPFFKLLFFMNNLLMQLFHAAHTDSLRECPIWSRQDIMSGKIRKEVKVTLCGCSERYPRRMSTLFFIIHRQIFLLALFIDDVWLWNVFRGTTKVATWRMHLC